MEQREFVASEDYGSRGVYGKGIKIGGASAIEISIEKKLKENVKLLGLDYAVKIQDVEIFNHKNFEKLNALVYTSAIKIKSDLVKELKGNEEEDLIEFVQNISEEIIDDAANNIYTKLSSKYSTKTHVKETTIARLKFSIVSYIVLILKTIKQIEREKKILERAYTKYANSDEFENFLDQEYNIEDKIDFHERQDLVQERIVQSISIESDNENEIYEVEFLDIDDEKILLKFKENGKYMTIERCVKLLSQDMKFLTIFIDTISNVFEYCILEFIPIVQEEYENKIFEMIAIKMDKVKADIKEFKTKIGPKAPKVITFRKGKDIYVLPNNLDKKNIENYSSPQKFSKNGMVLQVEEFYKTLSLSIENNIRSMPKTYISSEGTNWFHMRISPNNILKYENFQ